MSARGVVRAARVAAQRMRVSFFVGVALVPTLLTELLDGIGWVLPWWGWSLLLTAAILALFSAAAVSDRRLRRRLSGLAGSLRNIPDLETVTDLVVTAHLGKSGPQNLHTLLPILPGVRRIYLIVSDQSHTVHDAEAAVRALLQDVGHPDVAARLLQAVPAADLDVSSVDELARQLDGIRRLLGPQDRVVVDITGGTVPMSLTAYHAAVRAGLPVTYTSGRPGRAPGGGYTFSGLIAVHEPLGVLIEGGQ